MNELEQAIKLNQESKQCRDETRQVLLEISEFLEKIERSGEQACINQRRIALAVSSLLPSETRKQFNLNESDIENTVEVAQENVDAIAQRKVFDIVHAINVLAMANTDVIHIFTNFMGHVNTLELSVEHAGTNYQEANRKEAYLARAYLKLSEEGALEKLLSIESQLTELIITAREEAEAEVEA